MTPFLLYLLLTFGAGYSHYKGWKGLTLVCSITSQARTQQA